MNRAQLLLLMLLLVSVFMTIAAAAGAEADAEEAAAPKPFWPPKPREWAGIVLTALGLLIAGGSGIGAGGLVLPLFIILFEMPAKRASALTSCTVMVRAVSGGRIRGVEPSEPCPPLD